MRFHVITIFPNIFDSYLGESLFKRAQKKKLVQIIPHDLRDFTRDKHQKVDDRPFGGGPGMVVQVAPVHRAVNAIANRSRVLAKKRRTVLFSLRGKKLDAATAKRLARYDELVLICGRYEGVDERVATHIADEEISIGDYVLSGGELPALVLMEAVSRHVPGFLGKGESLEEINGSFPTYTRPEIFVPNDPARGGIKARGSAKKKWNVPKVLLSGDHKKIEAWRRGQ
ncbi:MAG TPA: tRNA (guanosine(37)-N1)-methyltransferase TrmD [Candidatus Paceibacterota bacterium]|jgi:tRNA (guanine37-N1)-methyltransferase|nr:tRNA (guanosine(37)-N1)-methyltransferase TrmD [Candidatus Paceibacterota bacterium]